MKTESHSGSAEDTPDLPPNHPDRQFRTFLREFDEASPEKQEELVVWLIIIAAPGEALRKTVRVGEEWAWNALIEISRREDNPPGVEDSLRWDFLLPAVAGEIERPSAGKGRPRKEDRDYDIAREVYILTESEMSDRAACGVVAKERNLSTDAVRSAWKRAVKTGFMVFFPETKKEPRRIVLVGGKGRAETP